MAVASKGTLKETDINPKLLIYAPDVREVVITLTNASQNMLSTASHCQETSRGAWGGPM